MNNYKQHAKKSSQGNISQTQNNQISSNNNVSRRSGIKQLSSASLYNPTQQPQAWNPNQQQPKIQNINHQQQLRNNNQSLMTKKQNPKNQVLLVQGAVHAQAVPSNNQPLSHQMQTNAQQNNVLQRPTTISFNEVNKNIVGIQEQIMVNNRPEQVSGGPTTIINNNNINFYTANPNNVNQQVPFFPQAHSGAIFGLVSAQGSVGVQSHQVLQTHQIEAGLRQVTHTTQDSHDSDLNAKMDLAKQASVSTSMTRQGRAAQNQSRQPPSALVSSQVQPSRVGRGGRIVVRKQAASRDQSQMQLPENLDDYGDPQQQQYCFVDKSSSASKQALPQGQAASKLVPVKKLPKLRNQAYSQQTTAQGAHGRRTGRKTTKGGRHPSLPDDIEPALVGKRMSYRQQSVGVTEDDDRLSGSQNFGSSIERVELENQVQTFQEKPINTSMSKPEDTRLRQGLGQGQPHSMSVFELMPRSALNAGENNPYNHSQLQDDQAAGTVADNCSHTPNLEVGKRKLFVRRDQLALGHESGQKIKPNIQIKRRHGALVSQDSGSFQTKPKMKEAAFTPNQNTDRLRSQEAYVSGNAFSPQRKGYKRSLNDKQEGSRRTNIARPVTAMVSRDSSLQHKNDKQTISSNLGKVRGRSLKHSDELNAYQQETPYLNRLAEKVDDKKMLINLPINSKHQKISIKAADLVYSENHFQSQQELQLPLMSSKLGDGNAQYSQSSLMSAESAKDDSTMRHSARRLVPMGKDSFDKLASRREQDPWHQMSTPNQEYSGEGDIMSHINQLTNQVSVSPWNEIPEHKIELERKGSGNNARSVLKADENIQDLEQQILSVEYKPREGVKIPDPDMRRLSSQATSAGQFRRQSKKRRGAGNECEQQTDNERWLLESAQILDQEKKVIAIGMNKDLEKTQRIVWKKQMESRSSKVTDNQPKNDFNFQNYK